MKYIDAYLQGLVQPFKMAQVIFWTAEGRPGYFRHQFYDLMGLLVAIAGNFADAIEVIMPTDAFDELTSQWTSRGDDLRTHIMVSFPVDAEPELTEMLLHKAFGEDLDVSSGLDVMKKASLKARETISSTLGVDHER